MSIRAAELWYFYIRTVKRPPICRSHGNACGDRFSLPPEQRDEWEDRLCAIVGCVVGLAVRLCASPRARPRCPDGGAGSGTVACASTRRRADAKQPLGQYPGGKVRKVAGVITRRSGG